MPNGLTIDQLYEAYMDIDEHGDPLHIDDKTPFAEDVFNFMGLGEDPEPGYMAFDKEAWSAEYGMYLPTFDPAQIHLAERERDLDYRSAMNTLKTTQEATERVYNTELDTLSTGLGRELSKAKTIAGHGGLRTGTVESAIEDTMSKAKSKAEDFGDRLRISEQETKDKYNNAMVDTALDYDKTVRQEKEEFYDRTMASIMKLMDKGAFDATSCADAEKLQCVSGECVDSLDQCPPDICGTVNGTETDPLQCHGGTPNTTINGGMITGSCEYGSCDFNPGCQQVCTGAGANMYGGGITMCIQDCTGAMAGGAGTWSADNWVIDTMAEVEQATQCPGGGGWQQSGDGFAYFCNDGSGNPDTASECYNDMGQYICGSTGGSGGCVESYCCTASCQPKFPGCNC